MLTGNSLKYIRDFSYVEVSSFDDGGTTVHSAISALAAQPRPRERSCAVPHETVEMKGEYRGMRAFL